MVLVCLVEVTARQLGSGSLRHSDISVESLTSLVLRGHCVQSLRTVYHGPM